MGGTTPRAGAPIASRPDRLCRTSATLPLHHSCAPSPMERHPNSSLPPSRGEVRWGVRRHAPAHQSHPAPDRPCRTSIIPAPPPQWSGAPIHPSPLPGGRLGGGCDATRRRTNRARPDRLCRPSATLPLRHSCAPSPMERRPNSSLPPLRGEVRWGVRRHEPAHQSRWTLITPAPITPAAPASSHPLRHSCALPVTPAPSPPLLRPPRHSCAGRNDRSANTP